MEDDFGKILAEVIEKLIPAIEEEKRRKKKIKNKEKIIMEKMKITKCRGCGMPIFFKDGIPWYAKQVPVMQMNDKYITTFKAYVLHFVNCPKADEFLKKKGKAVEKENDTSIKKTILFSLESERKYSNCDA